MLLSAEVSQNLAALRAIDVEIGEVKHPQSVPSAIANIPIPPLARRAWASQLVEVPDALSERELTAVVARSRPRLIDTARRGERHWASDPARLCADLWVTNWDRDPDSYFWEKLSDWRQFVVRWRHDENVDPGKKNERVWSALNWTRRNLPNLFDLTTEENSYWQFQLALAIEFLTMSGYPDIPMPKRCLAAIAATDILDELDTSVPWLK